MDQAQQELNRALATATVGQQRARVLTNVAGVEQKLHRFDDSVAHLRQALEEMEAAVGSRHPDVARILDFYAAALRRAGHATSAKQAAQRAREIRSVLATTVDWRELQ